MTWPEVGRPLPRSADAYAPAEKWEWILSDVGHGAHLRRVFGPLSREQVWEALTGEAIAVPIFGVRHLGRLGRSCEIRTQLTLNGRVARVVIIWHYDNEAAAPRLITVYPTT